MDLLDHKLPDEIAEQVRRSHATALRSLLRRIEALETAASQGWEYVALTEIDSAVTEFFVKGYPLTNREELRIDLDINLSTGVSKDISATPTGAAAIDLDSQVSQAGTNVTFANAWSILRTTSADKFKARIIFNPRSGTERHFVADGVAGALGVSGLPILAGGFWNDRQVKPTGLKISSSVASAILAGSFATLYKRPIFNG